MRNAAITLIFAMAAGTVLPAVWDTLEQRAAPEAALAAPTPAQRKSNPHWEYVPVPDDLARGPRADEAAIPPAALT